MGWDIDATAWFKIRDKILRDRYAGIQYSMATSFSPVIIRHRLQLPMKDRKAIVKLFPKWIRVEFQEVDYQGEQTTIYGRGDFVMHDFPIHVQSTPQSTTISKDES